MHRQRLRSIRMDTKTQEARNEIYGLMADGIGEVTGMMMMSATSPMAKQSMMDILNSIQASVLSRIGENDPRFDIKDYSKRSDVSFAKTLLDAQEKALVEFTPEVTVVLKEMALGDKNPESIKAAQSAVAAKLREQVFGVQTPKIH